MHVVIAQSSTQLNLDILAEFKSFVMNNKAFGNLFYNSLKSFHTSPGSSDSNNRGYRSFFKLNNVTIIIHRVSIKVPQFNEKY